MGQGIQRVWSGSKEKEWVYFEVPTQISLGRDVLLGLGMIMEWGRFEVWSLFFALHDFVLPHPRPASHDGENFLALSLPLEAPQNTALPRKTLLFVNFPTTITIVFNKTCFINKNILKITNNFIPSNQTNF